MKYIEIQGTKAQLLTLGNVQELSIRARTAKVFSDTDAKVNAYASDTAITAIESAGMVVIVLTDEAQRAQLFASLDIDHPGDGYQIV